MSSVSGCRLYAIGAIAEGTARTSTAMSPMSSSWGTVPWVGWMGPATTSWSSPPSSSDSSGPVKTTSSLGSSVSSTMQWAAVSTRCGEISVPEQSCSPSSRMSTTAVC